MLRPTLVILAAGQAVRFGGSKQTEAVGPAGETILDYSIFDAVQAGFGEVIMVIGSAFPVPLRNRIAVRWEDRITVQFVIQSSHGVSPDGTRYARTRLWGTGHALLSALPQVHGSFAVINADDYYGPKSFRKLGALLSTEDRHPLCDGCMVGFRLEQTLSRHGSVSRGICHSEDGILTQVHELKKIVRDSETLWGIDEAGQRVMLSGNELVSMNMWGFRSFPATALAKMFDEFIQDNGSDPEKEFYLPAAVNRLISSHNLRIQVVTSTDLWFGLTYAQDLSSVQTHIAKRVRDGYYPGNLIRS